MQLVALRKFTVSPAHERISAPPSQQPVHHPKVHRSSLLHRIRPPLLAHVINRPPPGLLNGSGGSDALISNWSGGYVPRPTVPLSPLPPFLRFTRLNHNHLLQ
ncbi:VQ motif-containing protein 9 [Raphanus sativus]|nr:VQ motif-containing protein 9 [Raphanus sativus]